MGENQTTRLKYLMTRTYVQSDPVNGAGQLPVRMQRVVVIAIGVSTKVLVGRPVDTDDAGPSSGTLNMNDGCDAQMSVVLVTPIGTTPFARLWNTCGHRPSWTNWRL